MVSDGIGRELVVCHAINQSQPGHDIESIGWDADQYPRAGTCTRELHTGQLGTYTGEISCTLVALLFPCHVQISGSS